LEKALRVVGLAALMVAGSIAAAAASDMRSPRISYTTVQWNEVAASLNGSGGPPPADLIARLNKLTGELFAGITASPVPVLLPFDTAGLLRDRAAGTTNPLSSYLGGLRPPPFFQTGPGGYDAAFSIRAKEDLPGSGITYSERIDVHISGSALLYDLGEPAGMVAWPVGGGREADVPGIKRNLLESQLRYTFVRFGVPYVVSIECHDGGARFRKVSCRDADKVAMRFLKALQVAGGSPQPQSGPIEVNTVERPQAMSTVFTYHAPGDILPGSGMRGHSGRSDYTIYSKMRFPLLDAPAFANSQSFMHWGNCDQTGRVSMGQRDGVAAYRCRVNDVPLIADESANYAYPWRDNFCEHRAFFVGECPGGLGHQGQDIRPSTCKQRIKGANRCEPYQHDVVAVRDGMVLRSPGQASVHIVTNTANERVRFRYLHMSPKQLDSDGLLSGRAVQEGEVIGKVGNYLRRERATTYHLHFDMQVPTKYGWVFVNPYMTLVAAYERQIRGRGLELRPDGSPVTPDSVGETAAIASAAAPEPPTNTALAVDDREPWPVVAPRPEQGTLATDATAIARPAEEHLALTLAPMVPSHAAASPAAPAALAPHTTPAANPIESDLHWDAINRIASETAGDERRPTVDP
jgi:murein DD-endopeptidase MepM/ murein hydrolase activator NlpD